MSYLMTFLLITYPPYQSFKYFCNLVLTKEFLYKTYLFKKKYLNKINVILEHMVSKFHITLYNYLKANRIDLWNIYWVEWVYAMFLRTFDLKTCFLLWDLMLAKGEMTIVKLTCAVFELLEEQFQAINKERFFDESKKLILGNIDRIVENVRSDQNHEFEYFYIQRNVWHTKAV